MNIIFETQITQDVKDKYILLELDSFRFVPGANPVKSYCLVEKISLEEMLTMKNFLELHQNLIENYHKQNWNYCEQALEHLIGRWNSELDSFYHNLADRINTLRMSTPEPSWDGVINRFQSISSTEFHND
jgi:hypothetical protein